MSDSARLISMRQVTELTSLSRATVYRRIADKRFPLPVDLGGRRIAFHRSELDRWMANPTAYEQGAAS